VNDADLIKRLEQMNDALRQENSRLRTGVEQYRKQKKYKASPRGSIDEQGTKAAAKAGVGCGFAGAWSDDVMQLVDAGAQHAGGWVTALYHTTMVEDVVGWCIGFLVGSLAVGFYKFTKKFE